MRFAPLACGLCLVTAVQAADFHTLAVTHDDGRYLVNADVSLAAPPPAVMQVLTDYDHLTRITDSIRRSRVLERTDAQTALVFTDTCAYFAFVCRHVLEVQRVTVLTPQDIVSQALPERSNVREATGSLHLEPEGDGTRMHWEMTVVPKFWIPPFIGPMLVERNLRRQGRETAEGVERLARQLAGLPPLSPDPEHDAQEKNSPP